MRRINEFHNIMPIVNVASALRHGLLSHAQASRLDHADISLAVVQEQRDKTTIPGGTTLHRYANVYFHARNPMMYLRRNEAESLCVLIISKDFLKIQNVVVANQNAASGYVRFLSTSQINGSSLDFDLIYADDWRHDDKVTYWKRKSRKCAEVLVPDRIPLNYIQGAYVVSNNAASQLQQQGFKLPVHVNPHLFFQ